MAINNIPSLDLTKEGVRRRQEEFRAKYKEAAANPNSILSQLNNFPTGKTEQMVETPPTENIEEKASDILNQDVPAGVEPGAGAPASTGEYQSKLPSVEELTQETSKYAGTDWKKLIEAEGEKRPDYTAEDKKLEEELARHTQVVNEAMDLYKSEKDSIKQKRLWESLINAAGMIASGLYGLNTGTDMSGVKFSQSDWQDRLENAKADLDASMKASKEKHSVRTDLLEKMKRDKRERFQDNRALFSKLMQAGMEEDRVRLSKARATDNARARREYTLEGQRFSQWGREQAAKNKTTGGGNATQDKIIKGMTELYGDVKKTLISNKKSDKPLTPETLRAVLMTSMEEKAMELQLPFSREAALAQIDDMMEKPGTFDWLPLISTTDETDLYEQIPQLKDVINNTFQQSIQGAMSAGGPAGGQTPETDMVVVTGSDGKDYKVKREIAIQKGWIK